MQFREAPLQEDSIYSSAQISIERRLIGIMCIFLVAGHSKAHIVHEILKEEEKREQYPAGLINPVRGKITWLIDKEAAKRL